jgi:hypothetical protein
VSNINSSPCGIEQKTHDNDICQQHQHLSSHRSKILWCACTVNNLPYTITKILVVFTKGATVLIIFLGSNIPILVRHKKFFFTLVAKKKKKIQNHFQFQNTEKKPQRNLFIDSINSQSFRFI